MWNPIYFIAKFVYQENLLILITFNLRLFNHFTIQFFLFYSYYIYTYKIIEVNYQKFNTQTNWIVIQSQKKKKKRNPKQLTFQFDNVKSRLIIRHLTAFLAFLNKSQDNPKIPRSWTRINRIISINRVSTLLSHDN